MKKIRILLIALLLVLGGVFFSNTYAANTQRSLGAQMERPFETKAKYQYGVKGETNGSTLYYTVVKIYDNNDKDDSGNLLYARPFYCLRGGKGFGAGSTDLSLDVSSTPIDYTQEENSEMHTDAKTVIDKYKELYGIDLERTESINGADGIAKDVNIYNAILWILDESYLPKDKINGENEVVYKAADYKKELLDKVGVPSSQQADITDNDLEVIQQLALWYFTNYDEQKNGTNPTVSQATKFPTQFLKINGNNNIDNTKANNLDLIYQYFINGAIENNSSYEIDQETGARTKKIATSKFDKTETLIIASNNDEYYQIGPVKIATDVNDRAASKAIDSTSIVLYDAKGMVIPKVHIIKETFEYPDGTEEIKEAGMHTIYRIVDESGNEVTSLQEGIKYYVRFYKAFEEGTTTNIPGATKYDISKVSLKVMSSYNVATSNFLYATENANINQAVVEIDKEKINECDEITTKRFDLALRKFITTVDGKVLTGEDSRVPSINTTTLIDGLTNRTGEKEYTATYTHPKNALQVKTGDKVIYTIRIYNEGDVDGTATKVTDYLPSGLELVPTEESTINTTYKWTNPSGDGKTIVTDYLKDTTIKAFNKTLTAETAGEGWQAAEEGAASGLYYADLQVECKVVAEIAGEDQDLRNIAEITEDSNNDRDSLPGNVDINNYNPEGNNSTYQEDDDDYEDLILPTKKFDLALRKYITAIKRNGKNVEIPNARDLDNIDITKLASGEKTTAEYKHRKDAVEVQAGDIITYRLATYNEGDITGFVYSIKDYLPQYLEFVPTEDFVTQEEVDNYKEIVEADLTEEEKVLKAKVEKAKFVYSFDAEKRVLEIKQKAIMLEVGTINHLWSLNAFDGEVLDSKYIDVTFKLAENFVPEKDTYLTNVATMTYGSKGGTTAEEPVLDRDSNKTGEEFEVPAQDKLVSENEIAYKGNTSNKNELNDSKYHYEGQQDDDDFEKLVVKGKAFDLSLRKFITSVRRNGEEVEFEDRTPKIDLSTLINGTFDRNGQKEYTATYEHSKEPLVVKQGDIVTYTLRIYNEGERDGFATEITDYIPEGLALILNYNTNFNNGWKLQEDFDYDKLMNLVGEKGFYKTEQDVKNLKLEDFENIDSLKDVQLATGKVTITSSMLQDELIKAFDKTIVDSAQSEQWQKAQKGEGGLYYKDIQVSCLVIAENTCKDVLTNIAEISEDKDEYKQDVNDRDSIPDNVVNKNEDDDDYEPVVLRYFDLALRKFITGVETAGKIQDITTRIPVLKMDKDGKIIYEHSKEPVYVANNDTVIYTLRVYNEGTLAGYAEEVTDDIPEGLEFLPEHSVNKQYEWVMIDKEGKVTEKVEDAEKITTDYLSEEKEIKSKMSITDETTGETTEPTNIRDNLIAPFDSSKEISDKEPLNPDYKDIKVAFKVTEPNTSDRIIVNSAQISEDSDDDDDSIPGKWNEGEDDQDKEYIYVKYFDLSLLKWVTQTIVTVDGKTTTTETGFEPNTGKTETKGIRDNKESEPIAKVELDRKKLKKTIVKFVYNIKVTNEGEIAGYATEITDYIPEGLEFFSEDNKAFGWEKEGKNKVTTRALETVLLEPGESATVKIVFRWKNDSKNLGLKTNVAEISQDYNEHNSKDIDSITDNKKDPYEKEQEDDDDFALVILSIKTGKGTSYTILIISMLTLLASGMYLIKKYVLNY